MAIQPRLIALAMAAASLITVALLLQHRAADANRQQQSNPVAKSKQPASQAGKSDTANNESADTLYLDLTAALKAAQQSENEIRKALQKPITVDFKETPLKDAISYFEDQCDIQIKIDTDALSEEGLESHQPITFTRHQPLPASTVLASMLEELALTTYIRDEMLIVSTEIEVEEKLRMQLYETSALARAGYKIATLAKVIERTTSGPWQEIDGTGGWWEIVETVLIIRTTEKVHAEVATVLQSLERIAASPAKSGTVALHMSTREQKVYNALSRKISVDFQKSSLKDVALFWGKLSGINIVFNQTALMEEGIAQDEPITAKFKNITLKSAIQLILEPFGLTYVIENDTLTITTEIDAEEKLNTFVFNVRDFAEAGYDMDQLIESITSSTSGPWMGIDGAGGSIVEALPGLLIVNQTWKVLEESAFHVDELRDVLKKSSPNGQLPTVTQDPATKGLTFKQYQITSQPVEEVSEAIQKLVAPDSWKSAGGKGQLAVIESKILIRQSPEVHERIAKFIKKLSDGSITSGPPGSGFFNVD